MKPSQVPHQIGNWHAFTDLFRQHDAESSRFTEGDKRLEHISGLETWFTLPGAQAIIPPPRLVMPNLARLLKGWLYQS